MGTALTGEQLGELARMAQTVLLALDADSAGQEAMLRAAGLAARRKLELRVVPLPAGSDPADLIQRDGPEAMRAAVAESVAFVRFRVERVLAGGDHSTPEGRDRMIEELRPVFATLAPSAMRMELTRMVSGRLALPESLAETLLAPGRGPTDRSARAANGSGGRGAGPSGREETERAFLALCIASPPQGSEALASLDVDEHFASELLRRAARRLRDGSLHEPMAGDPERLGDLDEDPELKSLLAELVVEAGREQAHPAMLEVQRLQLQLARLDREVQRARGAGVGDVTGLAQQRAEVKREFDLAYSQVLDDTGEKEG
jgi:DNA primase